jgi:heme/copper-type cytochrome/quinol oxidase subunit 2
VSVATRWAAEWAARIRGAGFFILVLALCAGLGLLIALPLWLFATREPRIYTVLVLALLAAGLVFLVVRGIRRRAGSDEGRRRVPALARLFTVIITIVSIAGLYSLAALLAQGLWILSAVSVIVSGLLLWLLFTIRGALRKRQKPLSDPAENSGR